MRLSEQAAIELKNGLYRLIDVSWERNAHGDYYDYFHAGVEPDGRWNAEFFDNNQQSIWVYGIEDTLEFSWQHRPADPKRRGWDTAGDPSIKIQVSDVPFKQVPSGALCQTVDERGDGIPRHWKKWRIV